MEAPRPGFFATTSTSNCHFRHGQSLVRLTYIPCTHSAKWGTILNLYIIRWFHRVISGWFVASHKTMETPVHALDGSNNISVLARSQTSRFRAEWKENVLTLGMYEEYESLGYSH